MKEQFVPYELALKLKELGFNEKCFSYYNTNLGKRLFINSGDIKVPLWQQAFDWFRDKYNYNVEILTHSTSDGFVYSYRILTKKYGTWILVDNSWFNFEEARLECLKELIELVENK